MNVKCIGLIVYLMFFIVSANAEIGRKNFNEFSKTQILAQLHKSKVSNLQTNMQLDEVNRIHYNAIVVDTHNDTMTCVIDNKTWLPVNNIGKLTTYHIDIPKSKKGGLDVSFFGSYSTDQKSHSRNISMILALINALYWTANNNKDSLETATSLDEIYRLVDKGKIAAIASIEGAYSLRPSDGIALLHQYYDLGIRAIALTWNYSNLLGEGVERRYINGTPSRGGLTSFGRRIVKEMNHLGIIVDVSHMAESTFWDTVRTSKAPIIASHSGVYSITPVPRNLKDAQIKAIAKNGGVVQVVFCTDFLAKPASNATVKTIVDHINYIVKLVGVDYVGLGSDFDGCDVPKDLKDVSGLPKITKELIKRGYKEAEIYKILGGNILRVFKQVEKIAEKHSNPLENFSIKPTLKMGEVIDSQTPKLTAYIKTNDKLHPNLLQKEQELLKKSSFHVILDGATYIPKYDNSSGILSYQVKKPLTKGQSGFHVITFKVTYQNNISVSKTRIFYIK